MTNLLQHPCWGKRYLYSAEKLAVMDAEYTAAVAKDTAVRRVRDDNALIRLRDALRDGAFHHATYRSENSPGWHIYLKADNGFNGFTYGFHFGVDSHVKSEVETLVRGTGYSVGSYGNG